MDGNNGFRSPALSIEALQRIDVEVGKRHIHENRRRAQYCDRHCCCRRTQRRNKNFIARTDAKCSQRDTQRARSGPYAYAVSSAAISGKFIFERGYR
jgi:hypothetical protein